MRLTETVKAYPNDAVLGELLRSNFFGLRRGCTKLRHLFFFAVVADENGHRLHAYGRDRRGRMCQVWIRAKQLRRFGLGTLVVPTLIVCCSRREQESHRAISAYLFNALLHGPGGLCIGVSPATEQRRETLVRALPPELVSWPWFAHGLGFTRKWRYTHGSHDMCPLLFVEGGLVGTLLYIALIGLGRGYSSGPGRVVAVQFIIAGFFTHNPMEQRAFLMMMTCAVAHDAAWQRRVPIQPAPPPGIAPP